MDVSVPLQKKNSFNPILLKLDFFQYYMPVHAYIPTWTQSGLCPPLNRQMNGHDGGVNDDNGDNNNDDDDDEQLGSIFVGKAAEHKLWEKQ